MNLSKSERTAIIDAPTKCNFSYWQKLRANSIAQNGLTSKFQLAYSFVRSFFCNPS